MRHANPVTIGELEKALAQLQSKQSAKQQGRNGDLFNEVIHHEHQHQNPPELN
jgi:hypothetical protein